MENVAVIELNSLDIRLTLLKLEKGLFFNIYDQTIESIRFGKDLETNNIINPLKIQETLKILKMFRSICDNNGISKIVTIATSVFKNAKNQRSFFEEIYNNTAFSFVILSEEEEIRNTYLGTVNSVDVQKGVILNVEPNATNIICYNRRNVLSINTIPYGSVNLAECYSEIQNPQEKWQNMYNFIFAEISKIEILFDEETSFIGSGDTYVSLGRLGRKLIKYPLDIDNNFVATNDTCNQIYSVVKDLDLDKSKKLKGISEDRADIIASGFVITKALQDYFKYDKLTISAYGFREGVIYNNLVPETNDKPLGDMLGYSLETINQFYGIDCSNSKHVAELSLILFRQLKVLHKLPRAYLKPLRIAVSMFDCGKRIVFDNNSKCSFDVIINSKLNGVSHRDLLISAFACVCQNIDNFSLSDWIKYKDILQEEDLDAVRKLGVIMMLSQQLDKSKMGNVIDVCCDILGDSIIIKTIVKSDAEFDIMQGMKIASDFKKIFKRNLQII